MTKLPPACSGQSVPKPCRAFAALFFLLLLALPVHAAGTADRPNILWLVAEDLGPQLGCYGTREVITPSLDRLAHEGVRFTAFYSGMVCSPSRSAFSTGMYATTIGAHNHRSHRTDGYRLPDGVRVLSDWLRDAGYFTANIVQLPPACGFKGTGKTDWNFTYEGKPFDSDNWTDLKTHQPFYAQVNFQETHRPFKAPKHADPAKVAIPPYYPDHSVTRADWASYLDAASELDRKVGLVLRQLEEDGLADNTVVFFFGDNGQSHVRGKQFCYEEGLHVPLIVRWPKTFPAPPRLKTGGVDSRLLESIDLAPTALQIAGASLPPKMQGRPLWGEKANAAKEFVFGARDRCDETVMRIRTVRDSRYRYIRNFTSQTPFLAPNAYKEKQYPVWNLLKQLHAEGKLTPAQEFLCQPKMPAEELYDLQADPFEIDNLTSSSRSQHRAALTRLRGVLENWIRETGDQGATLETAQVVEAETRPAATTRTAPRATKTEISIVGDGFQINGEPTYKSRSWQGRKIEGLLLNARLVQGIFDDRNTNTVHLWAYPDTRKWDPDRNTREFIAAMPEWRRSGLLAFTINLQGGSPQGYSSDQPWHNSAFEADGSLRTDYTARLERIINRADELGMAVILGYFYFGQDQRLTDEAAVLRATDNATKWVLGHGWRNVLIEVNNECNVRYDHPILQPGRVHELIHRVKGAAPNRRLLVGTSYGGGTVPKENVVRASDFLLMHGNGVSDPARIAEMVRQLRSVPGYTPKPILFNEDDHFDFGKPQNNFVSAIGEYASWGYFDPGKSDYSDGYQCPPVNWGMNTDRKKGFFRLLTDITGVEPR